MTLHNKHPNQKIIKQLLVLISIIGIICVTGLTSITQVKAAETTMSDVSKTVSDPKLYASEKDWKKENRMQNVGHVWSFLGLNTDGIMSKDRDNSVKTGIDSLVLPKKDSGTQNVSTVVKAAQLPIAMKNYGLDQTKQGMLAKFGRWLGGAVLFIALGLVFVVNLLITIVMWLITNLNPIMLIQTAMNSSGWGLFKITDGLSSIPIVGTLTGGAFGSIIKLIISLAFPVMLAALFGLVVAFLFWVPHSRNTNARGKFMNGFKWLFKRLVILFLVPSIAGSVFSAGLQLFGNGISSPAAMAQKQFNSTYIKYGDWIDNSRMYLPNQQQVGQTSITADYPSNNAENWKYTEPKTSAINPKYILAINALGAHDTDAINSFNNASDDISNSKGKEISNNNRTSGLGGLIGSTNITNSNTMNDINNASVTSSLFPTVMKWIKGDTYTANDYESTVAGLYTKSKSNGDDKETSSDTFKAIQDSVTKEPEKVFSNGYVIAKDGIGYSSDSQGFGAKQWVTPNVASLSKPASLDANDTSSAPSGLSTIGMWNYLNTSVEGKTLTQLISSKSLTSTPGYSHSSVLIGGPGAQPFSSWLLLVAVLLASVVPTFVTAIMLTKLALQGMTEYKNMFLAMSGSVKAWIYLFRYAMKIMTGIFFVGVSALLIPTLIDATLSWINQITITPDGLIGDANAMWFAVIQVVEAGILIAIMIMAAKAFMASGSWIDGLVEFAVKGKNGAPSTLDKGMGIFDNAVSKGIDHATQGSSGELAQTLNRANKDYAHASNTMAKDSDGNLITGKHGELLGAHEVDETGRPLSAKEKRERMIDDLKEKLSDYKDRPTKKALNELREEASQQLEDANQVLHDGGYRLSEDQMKNPIQSLEEMSKMKHESLSPEVTEAAKQMHAAKKTLDDLDDSEKKLSYKDAMKQFVAGGASDETMDAIKSTKAGQLLEAAAVAGATAPGLKNLSSLQNLKAQTEQAKDLADGKDVDDSEFGGLGEKEKAISLESMSNRIEDTIKSADQLKGDFLDQADTKRVELGDKLQQLNNEHESIRTKQQAELQSTINNGQEIGSQYVREAAENLGISNEQFRQQHKDYMATMATGERHMEDAKENFISEMTDKFIEDGKANNQMPSKEMIQTFQQNQAKNFESVQARHQQLQRIANNDLTGLEKATKNHTNMVAFNEAINAKALSRAQEQGLNTNDPQTMQNVKNDVLSDTMKGIGKEMSYVVKDAQNYAESHPGTPLNTALSNEYNKRVQDGKILPFTSENIPYVYTDNMAQVNSIKGQLKHEDHLYQQKQKEILDDYSSWNTGSTEVVSKNVAQHAFDGFTVSNTPYLKQYLTSSAPRNTTALQLLNDLNSYQNSLKDFNNFELKGQNLTPIEVEKKQILQNSLNTRKRELLNKGISAHTLNNTTMLSNAVQDLNSHYSDLRYYMDDALNTSNLL